MNKTLYVTDLDGTLLSSAGEVAGHTAEIVNRLIADGMSFTFATARSVYSAKPITARLDVNVPCLLMNGVSIYDLREDRYIKNEYIPEAASAEILRAFEGNGVHCFMYKITGGVLTCYYSEITTQVMRSFAEVRKNQYSKPFVRCGRLADCADSDAVYFTTTGEYEELLPVKLAGDGIKGLNCAFYKDTYTQKWYLEFFSSEASKANGVRRLKELYGFDRVVAFGDNLNDLPMFGAADLSVAVGNAADEVKKAADIVIDTNDNDGVARWLASIF